MHAAGYTVEWEGYPGTKMFSVQNGPGRIPVHCAHVYGANRARSVCYLRGDALVVLREGDTLSFYPGYTPSEELRGRKLCMSSVSRNGCVFYREPGSGDLWSIAAPLVYPSVSIGSEVVLTRRLVYKSPPPPSAYFDVGTIVTVVGRTNAYSRSEERRFFDGGQVEAHRFKYDGVLFDLPWDAYEPIKPMSPPR